MINYDSSFLTNMLLKTGLVSEPQIQEAWEEIGYRTNDAEVLLQTLERKGFITPLQSSKVRKSEFTASSVGGYRLVYKIASGSFGRVYRAEDPHTGTVVAIKILRRRYSEDDHIIDLFEREGNLGLQLKHPNIVEVLGVSQDIVSKQYYIVMEFIEGGNLRDILQIRERHANASAPPGPDLRMPGDRDKDSAFRGLDPKEALQIMEDAVHGLSHAFSRGVTHRDIKLTNVLISSQGQVKLVDFGLAGIFTRKGLEMEGQEKVDRTVDYAGLEKATGVKPGDVRSDIYFLGCILYEMLTGRSPLLLTRDPRQRSSQQRFSSVTPMSPDEVKGPAVLFQLVERMMSLDPKVRYQTPSQLLEAIKEVRLEIDSPGSIKEAKRTQARTVFVVERDPRLQDALRQKIKEMGFRVLISGDPGRALERFMQQPFDMIVMDAGATGEEGRFTFDSILNEATRKGVTCAGILIVNEDQKEWAERMPAAPNRVALIRPLSMKQVANALSALLPAEDAEKE
jgi:serine/threonine protein kinase